MEAKKMGIGPMLNAYPDSVGGKLSEIVSLLNREEFKNTFKSFYILPSVFNTDLDRGFSLISYDISEKLADKGDIDKIKELTKKDYIFAPAGKNRQSAGSVAALGAVKYKAGEYISSDDHVPEYLRLSQAERELKEKESR